MEKSCEDHKAHEIQLADLVKRVEALEELVQGFAVYQGSAKEQAKTIFTVLGEVKELLRQYTIDMQMSMDRLSKTILDRLEKVEIDVQTLKGANGRKWDQAMTTMVTVLITAVVTYFLAKVTK